MGAKEQKDNLKASTTCHAISKVRLINRIKNYEWFRAATDEMTDVELYKLVHFWTSLKSFGDEIFEFMSFEQGYAKDGFPTASTCGYHLTIQLYSSKEIMMSKIREAICEESYGNY